jgi:hypothetical protein
MTKQEEGHTIQRKTHLFDLVLMRQFEDPVASDMVPLSAHVFLHIAQQLTVGDAHVRQEGDQVVGGVCSVWAAVVQTGGRQGFCEEFLAAERRVAAAALVGVAADVAVAVADVVEVFGFELFWSGSVSRVLVVL